MKKLVIFHICALPQLYVKQNQSTKNNQITSTCIQVCVMLFFILKVGLPLEKFSGSAPDLACNLDSQMNTRLCRMIVILPSLLEIISTLYHCGGTWMLLPSLVTPPVRLVVSFCTLKLCNKIFYIL